MGFPDKDDPSVRTLAVVIPPSPPARGPAPTMTPNLPVQRTKGLNAARGFRPLRCPTVSLNPWPQGRRPLPDRSERFDGESGSRICLTAFVFPSPLPPRMTTDHRGPRLRSGPFIRSSNRRGALQILSAVGSYLLLWALAIQARGTPSGRSVHFGFCCSLSPAVCFSLMHDCGHQSLFPQPPA